MHGSSIIVRPCVVSLSGGSHIRWEISVPKKLTKKARILVLVIELMCSSTCMCMSCTYSSSLYMYINDEHVLLVHVQVPEMCVLWNMGGGCVQVLLCAKHVIIIHTSCLSGWVSRPYPHYTAP